MAIVFLVLSLHVNDLGANGVIDTETARCGRTRKRHIAVMKDDATLKKQQQPLQQQQQPLQQRQVKTIQQKKMATIIRLL